MSNSEKFFLEDGSYIRYKKSGSGRPLVLLHTIRNRLEYFDRVTPFLTKFFTVYAIDLPGFGDSPVNKDVNYDQEYMAKAVADFVVNQNGCVLTGREASRSCHAFHFGGRGLGRNFRKQLGNYEPLCQYKNNAHS